ncbi:MAG: hypothetical protein EXR71_05925 [Myxococcales bacterium]|nr:hypothetical protein [Myxococcales bacterium]
MVYLWTAFAFADPTWPVLTTDEQVRFDRGDLVLRADTSTPLTNSTGLSRVNAPAAVLWREALDFEAKRGENPTLRAMEEYGRTSPDDWFVRFELSVFGLRVVIHDHWTCTPATMSCTWVQDPTRDSDVTGEVGFLIVRPEAAVSSIVFHSEFVSEIWAPGWVRKWLAKDQMVNIVQKLRERTEKKAGGG